MNYLNQHQGFEFSGFEFNDRLLEYSFHYRLDNNYFTETLSLKFPDKFRIKKIDNHIRDAIFFVHLALGISYWKLTSSEKIIIKSGKLNYKQAQFWQTTWTKGLGEYFYQNKIDYRNLIKFPNKENANKEIVKKPIAKNNKLILCIGGGKDSLVAAHLLIKQGFQFTPLIFGNNLPALKQCEEFNMQPIIITRKLDTKLLELNKSEKYFNGHVPFSLILAFVSALVAKLCNINNIAVANEHSANYGNIEYFGNIVNHQWSKSFEAEQMISKYLNSQINVNYFSLLRPYWELKIVKLFVSMGENFYNFTSCNNNFKQNAQTPKLWCGSCPKCVFVFSLFSAFLSRKELKTIFGKNLFCDHGLLSTFQELWGEINNKPFECVGEAQEVIAALTLADQLQKPQSNEVNLQYFADKFLSTDSNKKKHLSSAEQIINFHGNNNIPLYLQSILI